MWSMVMVVLASTALGLTALRWSIVRRSRSCWRAHLSSWDDCADGLPASSPATALVAAASELVVQQQAARTLASGAEQTWPDPGPAAEGEAPLPRIDRVLGALERHSLGVAAVEQVALAGFGTVALEAAQMPDALHELAGVPVELRGALSDLQVYLGSGQFGTDLGSAAHETAQHALQHILPAFTSGGHLDAGLLLQVARAAESHSVGPVAAWAGHELLDGLQALADHAQHSAAVVDAVQHLGHAAHAAQGVLGVDSVAGHVPWVTVAVSGVREVRLLADGSTDAGTALKNLSLDVAGTGAGAFVGMKLGAVAGTAVTPGLGTAIGAVAGAVAGAIAGRSTSNAIKLQPYRDAAAVFGEVDSSCRAAEARESEQLADRVVESEAAARQDYVDDLPAVPLVDGRSIRQAADRLRVATESYVAELELWHEQGVRAMGTTGRGPDVRGSGLARAIARTRAALSAVTAPDADEGGPADALLRLAAAGLPCLPAGAPGPSGAGRYRAVCADLDRDLTSLRSGHAAAVTAWAGQVRSSFDRHTKALVDDVQPRLDAFRHNQGRRAAELSAARSTVEQEAAKLGLT